MRTRNEIEEEWKLNKNELKEAELKIELLLDIRELLTPASQDKE